MGSNSVTASLLNSSPEKKKNRPPKKKLKMIKQNTEVPTVLYSTLVKFTIELLIYLS